MEHIPCALCGVDDTRPFKEENGYQAVQCVRCGLVYVNPRPSIVEMKHLYEGQETQIDIRGHILKRDHKCVQAQRCLRFIRKHKKHGRLLEIGSAAGYLLWEAQKAGFAVQGLDLTKHFVDFSKDVLGVPAFEGTLRDAPFEDESFDVIYHRNVMSHLAWPTEELSIMARLLARGGVLIFETGNVAELEPREELFLELPDHLFHFSEDTLRKLLERASLRHLETQRFRLVSELPVVQRVEQLFKRQSLNKSRRAGIPPSKLPESKLHLRFGGHWAQLIRYGVGSVLPGQGRCTLIVAAEKPAH